jgi:hypothetical protein
MTKGYVRHPMMLQQLAAVLGYDMNDNPKYQYLIELFTHLQSEYLLRYESPLGTVFTIPGLEEVESSLLEHEKPTRNFPSNIRRFVEVNESLVESIRKTRKARKDFLYCAFQEAIYFIGIGRDVTRFIFAFGVLSPFILVSQLERPSKIPSI